MKGDEEKEVCRLEAKSTKEQRVSAEQGGAFVAPVRAELRCLKGLDASSLYPKSPKKSSLKEQIMPANPEYTGPAFKCLCVWVGVGKGDSGSTEKTKEVGCFRDKIQ